MVLKERKTLYTRSRKRKERNDHKKTNSIEKKKTDREWIKEHVPIWILRSTSLTSGRMATVIVDVCTLPTKYVVMKPIGKLSSIK